LKFINHPAIIAYYLLSQEEGSPKKYKLQPHAWIVACLCFAKHRFILRFANLYSGRSSQTKCISFCLRDEETYLGFLMG